MSHLAAYGEAPSSTANTRRTELCELLLDCEARVLEAKLAIDAEALRLLKARESGIVMRDASDWLENAGMALNEASRRLW